MRHDGTPRDIPRKILFVVAFQCCCAVTRRGVRDMMRSQSGSKRELYPERNGSFLMHRNACNAFYLTVSSKGMHAFEDHISCRYVVVSASTVAASAASNNDRS